MSGEADFMYEELPGTVRVQVALCAEGEIVVVDLRKFATAAERERVIAATRQQVRQQAPRR